MGDATLRTDYLIVGSGAVGMAVADVLLHESDRSIMIVDRHHAPGGHWNDAYPFVRLHQPSASYGVNSRELGSQFLDVSEWNRGLAPRATGPEIVGYYQQVMDEMLASGRVRYLPKSEYLGDFRTNHEVRSIMGGSSHEVVVTGKVVDTSYLSTEVPSTRPPPYEVAAGVRCIPPNGLVSVSEPSTGYVVIGAGKTAIDACLWLLETGVPPTDICWVRPRDPLMWNRKNFQPLEEHFDHVFDVFATQLEIAADASTAEEALARLLVAEVVLQIDPDVTPTMFHGAIVSPAEVEALRSITDVVRMGRVQRIEPTHIVLEEGQVRTSPDRVHVDCTARGVGFRPAEPIWADRRITPQMVRSWQPTFSAALIAHVELMIDDEAEKNALCVPIPMTDEPADWVFQTLRDLNNRYAWSRRPDLQQWILESRLDRYRALAMTHGRETPERTTLLQRYATALPQAAANLARLDSGAG